MSLLFDPHVPDDISYFFLLLLNTLIPSETENGSSEGCHRRTISGSTKNLSNQGSLKNHFLKEFFKEPLKVSQIIKKVLQEVTVLRRTTKPFKEP